MKVQRKPQAFDAVQWTGTVTDEIETIGRGEIRVKLGLHGEQPVLRITTLHDMIVNVSDWLVRENGKLFVCDDNHFKKYYEPSR